MIEVPEVKPLSRAAIDKWGCSIIEQHCPRLNEQLGHFPLLDFLDIVLPGHYRVDTGIEDLPVGVHGLSLLPNKLIIDPEIYARIDEGEPQARFTGAHEITHVLQHIPQINARCEVSGSIQLYRREQIVPYRDPEWQANCGAAALLMPAISFWRFFGARLDDVDPAEIAAAFGVSYSAAGHRLSHARSGRMWRPNMNLN